MHWGRLVIAYRWPLLLGGLLTMSVVAHAVLVFVATRPSTPAPLADYYDRAERWEADQAVLEASARLGWAVRLTVPDEAPFALAARRPIDVAITDERGPISGLRGRLLVSRADESRLDDAAALVELPHAPGHYRALVRLPTLGLWLLTIAGERETTRFVHQQKIELVGRAP